MYINEFIESEFKIWDLLNNPSLNKFIKCEEDGIISINLNPVLRGSKVNESNIPQLLKESKSFKLVLKNSYLNIDFDNSFFNNFIMTKLYNSNKLPCFKDFGKNKVICIDFSSPNIAKNLGFHHIRSTLTGSFLSNLYSKLGYDVKKLNFLGDWGSGIAKLIFGYKYFKCSKEMSIDELHALYVKISTEIKNKQELQKEVYKIENILEDSKHDKYEEYINLWSIFKEITLKDLKKMYSYFDITFDDYKGESFFASNDQLLDLIKSKLSDKLKVSETGSMYLDLPKIKEPCFLFKNNGETIYTTRDLAAIKYRFDTYNFDKIYYVVDSGQNLHFKKVFASAKILDSDIKNMEHLDFGQVLMYDEDEKSWTKGSSRSGKTFKLIDIINLLIKKQKEKTDYKIKDGKVFLKKQEQIIHEFTKDEFEQNISNIALSGLIFDALRIKRRTNIKFNLDEILDMEGDTGPYVLYNVVRIRSIYRNYIGKFSKLENKNIDFTLLSNKKEKEIIVFILTLDKVIEYSMKSNESCGIAEFLIKLCKKLSSYYSLGKLDDYMKVITDDIKLSSTRMALLKVIENVIVETLNLMGIKTVSYM